MRLRRHIGLAPGRPGGAVTGTMEHGWGFPRVRGLRGAVSVVPAVTWVPGSLGPWVPGVPGIPGGSSGGAVRTGTMWRGCGSSGGRGRATGLIASHAPAADTSSGAPASPAPAGPPPIAALTTSMWQRRCCNHLAVTSTWLPRAAAPHRPHRRRAACTMRTTGTARSRTRPLTPEEPHPYDVEPVIAGTMWRCAGCWPGTRAGPLWRAGLPGPRS